MTRASCQLRLEPTRPLDQILVIDPVADRTLLDTSRQARNCLDVRSQLCLEPVDLQFLVLIGFLQEAVVLHNRILKVQLIV